MTMSRRGFLGALLALPFAPAVAKAASKVLNRGADQTSIWLTSWGESTTYGDVTLMDVAKRTSGDGSMLPVIEALNRNNKLLQDAVWKGPSTVGHRVAARSNLPGITFSRGRPTWR